ncbi:MAG TPA: MAPEG family protein [Myxococcota bacterium]|nr:MAPEG family protein [Myxococcota bacterium]
MSAQSTELWGLIAAAGLGLLHIVLASQSASLQRGYRWTAGPRDEPLPPLTGVAGRLARASANYLETFPYFAAGVLAVVATGTQSAWSSWGVTLYLAGRAAYLPLYAFGVFLLRSLAWNVALVGIAAIYGSLFR